MSTVPPPNSPRQQKVYKRPPQRLRKSVVPLDFQKRLRGKPTHVAPSRTWYRTVSSMFMTIIKIVVITLLFVGFVLGGFGGGLLAGYVRTSKPLALKDIVANSVENPQTSFIYDSSGVQTAQLVGSENIDSMYINYSEVKHTYIATAITAVEDERFYTHNGIDIRRIGSAVISMLANGGDATHGGSTITQQTVKLITGDDQRSTERKVQEWFHAIDLEKQLSKDQILDFYINLMPMGNNYIGVQAAAKNYFGKDATELTLAECAFLAGIPKSPTYYNPSTETGRRNAFRRQRIVLGMMHDQALITDAEYEEARNADLIFRENVTATRTQVLDYFDEYVIKQVLEDLMAKEGYSRGAAYNKIYGGGIRIYTTKDSKIQADLNETFNTLELFQSNPSLHINLPEKPQGSAAIIDNSNGAIVAMSGGYGPKEVNQGWNRAVDSHRQPGSAIKPLVVYAPALEEGKITPSMMIDRSAGYLDPQRPNERWPRGSESAGKASVRSNVTWSNNPAAVRVLQLMDYSTALYYLRLNGIDRETETYPSIAMGAFNKGMSTLEMSAAYATFANGGIYRNPSAYTHVTDADGNIILSRLEEETRVFSPGTAYLMTDMLEDVITSGTARGVVFPMEGIETAGKTGTTDDYKDKWFCGYTPYYSAAVWYGYDNSLRESLVPSQEENNAMRIWYDFMQKIHSGMQSAAFTRPDTLKQITICKDSGMLPGSFCTTITDWTSADSSLSYCTLCKEPEPEPEDTDDSDEDELPTDPENPDISTPGNLLPPDGGVVDDEIE